MLTLDAAVQNARRTAQQVTWLDQNGVPLDLTGATLTGRKRDSAGAVTSLTGTLTLVTAASGLFAWAYSVADLATPGVYQVQFKAAFSNGDEKTILSPWKVYESLVFASDSPSLSPSGSLSPSPSASVSPSASASPSASKSPSASASA